MYILNIPVFINNIRKRKSNFYKNTLSLVFGVGFSQTITFLSTLYLTHLYAPQNFGVFSFYSAMYSLISAFTTGRYALAISFSKNNKEAINLVALSLSISIFTCFLFFIIFMVIKNFSLYDFIPYTIQQNISLLIIGVFTNSIIQILTPWLNRKKRFKDLYLLQIIQASTIAFCAIILGICHVEELGLIFSFLLGQTLSIFCIIYRNRDEYKNLQLIHVSQMKKLGYKFRNFPLYCIITDFINNLSVNLPVFLLSAFYGEKVVGFYSLSTRILGAPNTLLASSISEVFKQRAVEDKIKYGTCQQIFSKAFLYLFFIGAIILFFTFVFSPFAFPLLFGDQWTPSGKYAQVLAFLYFIKFIVSPLSVTLYIKNKQNVDMYFHIALLIMIFLIMGGLHTLGFSALSAISGMVVAFVIVYGLYLYKAYKYSF